VAQEFIEVDQPKFLLASRLQMFDGLDLIWYNQIRPWINEHGDPPEGGQPFVRTQILQIESKGNLDTIEPGL
jgi:hypothetical protein